MNKTTAIIVTYNRLEFLKECLDALNLQSIPLSNIIIINNNSNDGTKEYLDLIKNKKGMFVVNLTENLGGAGGFYTGLKLFIEKTKDDFVWIMDDDTIPNENAHYEFLEATKLLGEFGFLASNVRWKDGTPAKMNIPQVSLDGWNEHDAYPRLDIATFVSILVPRKILYEVGYPIKEFFIWGDDTEFTNRISRKYKSYYVPNSKVIHKMAVNDSVNIYEESGDKERLKRYIYAYRNRMFYTKSMSKKSKFLYMAKIFNDIYRIIFNNTSHKYLKLKAIFVGIVKGVFFNPQIEFPSKIKE